MECGFIVALAQQTDQLCAFCRGWHRTVHPLIYIARESAGMQIRWTDKARRRVPQQKLNDEESMRVFRAELTTVESSYSQ